VFPTTIIRELDLAWMREHRPENLPLRAYLLGAMTLLLFLSGCGGDGRRSITGIVTLDGKPLALGSISFRATPEEKHSGGGGQISEGRFTLPANQGLFPGKYLVKVAAYQKTGRMIIDPQRGEVEELLPVKFRETGSLEATVSVDGTNEFEFNLNGAAR